MPTGYLLWKFFFQKHFFKRQKIKFKIITNSIYNKDGKLSFQNNYQKNLFHLKKNLGNSITFKEASLKISKNYRMKLYFIHFLKL